MAPNYERVNLEERAAAACDAHKDYIEEALWKYQERRRIRKMHGIVALGICGMGRAGKDTSAEYICGHSLAIYPKSASWQALPLVAYMADTSPDRAWEERHQNRQFWIEACHEIRGRDFTMLIRMCLGAGDVAVGIRGRLELAEATSSGIIDASVWIDNPRVPKDITVEYEAGDCDFIVNNHGSLLDFYARLRRLVAVLRLGDPTKSQYTDIEKDPRL